ncbi:MAG: ABC transporter substrate-binding protein [Bacteriovorax sp.]|nr:ABC transporter substrate-binding protein [Bacteriovorax sp.]
MSAKITLPLGILITILLIFAIGRFDPAPPNHLTISTGDDQSDIQKYAIQYKRILKAEGVTLNIRASSGPLENLKLLDDDNTGVSAAFVQDGIGSEDKEPDIVSLGSLYYEPIWIFYRSKNVYTHFSQLIGDKIAVGRVGHGAQVFAQRLLLMSGVDPQDASLLNMTSTESAQALKNGTVDAVILMLPADNKIIHELALRKDIKLLSLEQAEAISRKDQAFHHLILPRGAIDLESDIPKEDIDLVASTSTLLVRDDIHPALAYLLLKAATEVHSQPGIFEKRGEFPTNKDDSFSLSKDATQFYKSGAPFWQRYLPYWLAAWFDRFVLLIIPFLAFLLPLIRTIPKIYHWRLRSKIYQRYGELKFLETQIKHTVTKVDYDNYLQQLSLIEERVNKMKMPQNFSEYVYSLKGHIQFVRDRIEKTVTIES